MMIYLGIESTAHTFGIGVVDGERIIANEKDSYKPEKGGIVPAEAAEHHRKHALPILERALEKAGITAREIDVVSYAAGPGLPPCLIEGKKLAEKVAENKPVIGVNHCIAHIEIGKKDSGFKDPLTLYVSGGNTQVIALNEGRYRIFGETLDIGIGNALDKLAREMGLKMPGGPKIEKLAEKSEKYIPLPYTVKGMDFAFSGLLTAAKNSLNNSRKEDIAFSFQETAFAMLAEVSERALAHTQKKEVILTGGVAANKRLAEIIKGMAEEHNAEFTVPRQEYCGDNGAMIAWLGKIVYESKTEAATDVKPKWRTDQVKVTWE